MEPVCLYGVCRREMPHCSCRCPAGGCRGVPPELVVTLRRLRDCLLEVVGECLRAVPCDSHGDGACGDVRLEWSRDLYGPRSQIGIGLSPGLPWTFLTTLGKFLIMLKPINTWLYGERIDCREVASGKCR